MAPRPPPAGLPDECKPEALTADLKVRISAPHGDSSGVIAYGDQAVTESSNEAGVVYQRAFDALFLNAPDDTGAARRGRWGVGARSAH